MSYYTLYHPTYVLPDSCFLHFPFLSVYFGWTVNLGHLLVISHGTPGLPKSPWEQRPMETGHMGHMCLPSTRGSPWSAGVATPSTAILVSEIGLLPSWVPTACPRASGVHENPTHARMCLTSSRCFPRSAGVATPVHDLLCGIFSHRHMTLLFLLLSALHFTRLPHYTVTFC